MRLDPPDVSVPLNALGDDGHTHEITDAAVAADAARRPGAGRAEGQRVRPALRADQERVEAHVELRRRGRAQRHVRQRPDAPGQPDAGRRQDVHDAVHAGGALRAVLLPAPAADAPGHRRSRLSASSTVATASGGARSRAADDHDRDAALAGGLELGVGAAAVLGDEQVDARGASSSSRSPSSVNGPRASSELVVRRERVAAA